MPLIFGRYFIKKTVEIFFKNSWKVYKILRWMSFMWFIFDEERPI